jgi:ADP-ribose pyrophosphatase YjhB (NUDIX family)
MMTGKVDLDDVLANMSDPRKGLSDEVFHFIRKVTPLINVDLLIRRDGHTLLAWREDEYDTGWHIPGGIIRFREDFLSRIEAVALTEIGATVESESSPCNIAELREHSRGHFISLLYRCNLTSELDPARMYSGHGQPANGSLSWIEGLPKDFYPAQLFYRDWLEGKK